MCTYDFDTAIDWLVSVIEMQGVLRVVVPLAILHRRVVSRQRIVEVCRLPQVAVLRNPSGVCVTRWMHEPEGSRVVQKRVRK